MYIVYDMMTTKVNEYKVDLLHSTTDDVDEQANEVQQWKLPYLKVT